MNPDEMTSEPAPSAYADGYREAIRDALTVCREIRDVVSDGTPGQQPANAAAACCGAIARLVSVAPRTPAETDILAERAKQRAKWGDDHDDEHDDGSLADAGATLAAEADSVGSYIEKNGPGHRWPGHLRHRHRGDRRKQLVIAAALLIAEVERIDRARQ